MSNYVTDVPLINVPLAGPDGNMNPIWFTFFVQLWRRSGYASGDTLSDLAVNVATLADDPGLAVLSQALANINVQVQTLPADPASDALTASRRALQDAAIDQLTPIDPIRSMAYQDDAHVKIRGGTINLDAGSAASPSLKFNNETACGLYRESSGQLTATQDYRVTGKFGCNSKAPQAAFASSGTASAPPGGTGTAAGAWDTAANRDAAIAAINTNKTAIDNIITALKNNGIMS